MKAFDAIVLGLFSATITFAVGAVLLQAISQK